MNNVRASLIVVLMITVMLSMSCGKSEEPSPGGAGNDWSSFPVYNANGDFIGYYSGFNQDHVNIYSVDTDSYHTIHPTTGRAMEVPATEETEIYYASSNCTGTAIIRVFNGEAGKTYIHGRDNLDYRVTGTTVYDINNRFNALSKLSYNRPDNDECSNSNTTIYGTVGQLELVTGVPTFVGDAPLSLFTK